MKRLLALLGSGTLGTAVEPNSVAKGAIGIDEPTQVFADIGASGTRGTCNIHPRWSSNEMIATRVYELCDQYAERLAIIAEGRDVALSAAQITAGAEVGAAFVDHFILGR